MEQLQKLFERIVSRTKINLRDIDFDVDKYVENIVPLEQLVKFYSFYGISFHHPIYFNFKRSNLAGSYFLGTCSVMNSILYKSDIRGDELKLKGEVFNFQGTDIPLDEDEMISIKNSLLIKTLIHNFSHDPEKVDLFLIKNTISSHYANIHGAPLDGCFLGPFSTVDLTTLHDCVVGTYSYVQAGWVSHKFIPPGQIWVKHGDVFEFVYQYSQEDLGHYITLKEGEGAVGRFMDFAEDRKTDFQRLYDVVNLESPVEVPLGASINRYSVFQGHSHIDENVLVAQRAFIESSWLGKGANAQENCYISESRLEGYNVTAHGATIINAHLNKKVFVGFNSFLQGKKDCEITVGAGSIIMPHTIIHSDEPLNIPPKYLVWGYIRTQEDLKENSISLEQLSKVKDEIELGAMKFKGDGAAFVHAFQHRIEHILEANGAYFDGEMNRGHAQKGQNISFNIIQPYSRGPLEGLYPSIEIMP